MITQWEKLESNLYVASLGLSGFVSIKTQPNGMDPGLFCQVSTTGPLKRDDLEAILKKVKEIED